MTPRLPPALADWAIELDAFSDTLLPAFGNWLPKLAAMIGPMNLATPLGLAEPDGFDGVSQRGHYQRLLISEWLLADEAPLEFMRRAAMGQHMFRQLARREPSESRCCVLVFDAGPSQLGAPRLAHLALLAVFGRRTRRANARLLWGTASDPSTIREGLDASGIRAMLAGRSLDSLTSDRLAAWDRALAERELEVAERWVISDAVGGSIAGAAGWGSRVAIDEPFGLLEAPATRSLRVELREGASERPRRSLALSLPDDATSVAILRGRAAAQVPKVSQRSDVVAVERGLAIDPAGRRLIAWTVNGGVIAYKIPTSRGDAPSKPRRYDPTRNEQVLGATMMGKRLIALTLLEEQLVLRRFSKKGRDAVYQLEPRLALALTREPEALSGGQLVIQGQQTLYRSPSGLLIRMPRPLLCADRVVDDSILAISQCGEARAWLAGQSLMFQYRRADTDYRQVDLGELAPDGVVGMARSNGQPALLFQSSDGQHRLHHEGATTFEFMIGPPAGMTVVGIDIPGSLLLVLDAERRTLGHWLGGDELRPIEVFDSEVASITVGDVCGIVAVATRSGWLLAYSLDRKCTLLRMRVEVDKP